jgi:hypothetical protein
LLIGFGLSWFGWKAMRTASKTSQVGEVEIEAEAIMKSKDCSTSGNRYFNSTT